MTELTQEQYEQQEARDLQAIRERIAQHPELGLIEDLLVDGWGEGHAHWVWAATAPIDEILSWAQGIRADQRAEEAFDALYAEADA